MVSKSHLIGSTFCLEFLIYVTPASSFLLVIGLRLCSLFDVGVLSFVDINGTMAEIEKLTSLTDFK